jgi:chemotaxis protein MotB
MRTVLIAALVLSVGTGCAISDLKRINDRLKEENNRLLTENRDLRNKARRADRSAEDSQLKLEEMARRLALAERKAGQGSDDSDRGQLTPSALKGIADVDVEEGKEGIRVILSNKVFFRPGSVVISDKGKSVLNRVARVLNADYAGSQIRVDGHTDSTRINRTKEKYPSNWELSTDRACAVLRYLVKQGVSQKRIYAAGFSYQRPLASNETAAGQQQNRRVEIVILRS